MRVSIPVSFGELVDKITILEIKCDQIGDPQKSALALAELSLLREVLDGLPRPDGFDEIKRELRAVNETLWEAEERIRACEAGEDFGERFVALAQSIYRQNDRRYALKDRLNRAAGSAIREVKSHV
ncbi:hypothetical protein [Tropicimonas isoalkanivorans]|uniref:Uncharacterized protein n=1 Tax=Tropicimonas isoalkanivorans TaxID=441112 RepID=A0A1I1J2C4_9RHOB|nr:hypothetical protein [Tropicimonas isoalkanivorans]SFC39610.1 hypothetical protein SAMN04488094_104214 [Tropicimonas isoalkanivorans]